VFVSYIVPDWKMMSSMNRNTMYILVAVVVIIIVVAAVAAYVFVIQPSGGGGGGGGGEETVYTLGNATSVQFDVNLTIAGSLGTYNFAGKNLNSSTNLLLRVEANPVVSEGTVYSYIFYAGNETTMNNATGTWAEGTFATDWPTWSGEFFGYVDHNPNWMTGDGNISYTDADGNTVLIYNIVLNPTLPDSMFQPT
jgi:hypothetical protein